MADLMGDCEGGPQSAVFVDVAAPGLVTHPSLLCYSWRRGGERRGGEGGEERGGEGRGGEGRGGEGRGGEGRGGRE